MAYNKLSDKVVYFDSISEYFEVCAKAPMKKKTACGRPDDPDSYGAYNMGTRTWAEAQRLALKGWPEGVQKIEAMARRMSAQMVQDVRRPEITYDVTGDMFDIGRVVEGVPESWMTWQEGQDAESTQSTVHIVYNITASWGVDPKMLEMRGAAVAALCVVLEAAGRPVKVDVAICINGSREVIVTVKHPYDSVQVDALAYALVHAAMFRRHGFAIMGITGMGHGMPTGVRHSPTGDIYLEEALYTAADWENEETVAQWIRVKLMEQGVQFDESKA